MGRWRGDRVELRPARVTPRGSHRDGARARAPPRGEGQGCRDRARLAHPHGPSAQHRGARHRTDDVRRTGLLGDGEAEGVLRIGALRRAGARRRLAHDHRDGARRDRIADGRHDLRGVQGHRQLRDQARPLTRREAHLPGDRHRDERHAARGEALPPRAARARLHTAPRASADAAARPRMEWLIKRIAATTSNDALLQGL